MSATSTSTPERPAEARAEGDAGALRAEIARLEASARQQAALLGALVAGLEGGVIACDAAGRPLTFNEAALALTGAAAPTFDGPAAWIDHFGFARADGGVLDPADFALARALAGEDRARGEMIARRPGGRALHLDVVGRTLRDEAGGIAGAMITFQDVSARLSAERAETSALRARSAFLAAMSHEIRTPLAAIVGIASLLPDIIGDENELVSTLKTSSEHLVSVVNDVLDFSKLESGKLEVAAEELDLSTCIEGALDLVTLSAAERGIELVYDVADDVPEVIVGDPARLRQVLVNLLGNAVKFTERGEVVLQVRRLSNEGTLLVEVHDTGPGISAEAQARLFAPFSQGDASTTRAHGGTGLGLVISRRLVEAMGGSLDVTSVSGLGSTFFFTIPCPAGSRAPQPSPVDPRTALVVDGHARSRHAVGRMLARCGFDVVEVATPLDAESHLFERRFDAIVVDAQIADEEGAALLERVAAGDPGIHTVALTSPGISRSVPAGTAVLTKPVKPRELARAVLASRDPRRRISSAPTSRTVRRLRVLVAEDQPLNRRVVATMLERLGHDAVLVANGIEAVAAVAREPFDAILMDMHMPGMDGLEATKRIRAACGDDGAWILGVTANAAEEDRQLCLRAGMAEVITKPFTLQQLGASLRRALVAQVAAPAVRIETLSRLRDEIGDEVLAEVVGVYLEESPAKIERIVAALAAGGLDGVASAAHGLKSTSSTLGADALVEASALVEEHARAGRLEAARGAARDLGPRFGEVDRALRASVAPPTSD